MEMEKNEMIAKMMEWFYSAREALDGQPARNQARELLLQASRVLTESNNASPSINEVSVRSSQPPMKASNTPTADKSVSSQRLRSVLPPSHTPSASKGSSESETNTLQEIKQEVLSDVFEGLEPSKITPIVNIAIGNKKFSHPKNLNFPLKLSVTINTQPMQDTEQGGVTTDYSCLGARQVSAASRNEDSALESPQLSSLSNQSIEITPDKAEHNTLPSLAALVGDLTNDLSKLLNDDNPQKSICAASQLVSTKQEISDESPEIKPEIKKELVELTPESLQPSAVNLSKEKRTTRSFSRRSPSTEKKSKSQSRSYKRSPSTERSRDYPNRSASSEERLARSRSYRRSPTPEKRKRSRSPRLSSTSKEDKRKYTTSSRVSPEDKTRSSSSSRIADVSSNIKNVTPSTSVTASNSAAIEQMKPASKEDLSFFLQFSSCEICHVFFTSPIVAKNHLTGKNHLKKLRLLRLPIPDFCLPQKKADPAVPSTAEEDFECPDWILEYCQDDFCGVCNLPLSSDVVADSHYYGKKHKKKCLALYKSHMQTDVSNPHLYCEVCLVSCPSPAELEKHKQGQKHKATAHYYRAVHDRPYVSDVRDTEEHLEEEDQ